MSKECSFALCDLAGKNVDGWNIVKILPKPKETNNGTGGDFSVCYIAEKDGEEYFMKVLDLRECLIGPVPDGISRTQYIEQFTSEFNYEKELSMYCHNKRIRGVVLYIGQGEVDVAGYTYETVSYIIYEKADGDIRKVLKLSRNVANVDKLSSIVHKIKSLRDVTVGLQQLHNNNISHQDIKPSNVLSVGGVSKLGDLGSAICLDSSIRCPFNTNFFNGDHNFAPPEYFFKSYLPEEKERLFQMDNYMLGSLIVFYICGVSFNALMNLSLHPSLWEMPYSGLTYEEAKAYLTNAYYKALIKFESDIPIDGDVKKGLTKIVGYLCNPDVKKRGHPKNLETKRSTPNYDLERTFSQLDLLRRKAEIELTRLKNGIIS